MISELIVAYILAKNYSPPIVCDKACPVQPKYTVPIVCKMGKCPAPGVKKGAIVYLANPKGGYYGQP